MHPRLLIILLLLLLLHLVTPSHAQHLQVRWYAPFFSGGGYCSEAIAFVQALSYETSSKYSWAIAQHGDSYSPLFHRGLSDETRMLLDSLLKVSSLPADIVICHSEPGAWKPARYQTTLCPTADAQLKIGRTMFETDRLPDGWKERMYQMDSIWVPTQFHKQVFAEGGVPIHKIRVVPEPVDVSFFNPSAVSVPFQLNVPLSSFVFLSIFKWEERKGWRFLIRAYVQEFTANDDVALVILTNAYHSSSDFNDQIDAFLKAEFPKRLENNDLPLIRLLPSNLDSKDIPRVYKAAQAFVLPSRGEGWGRPHVEAMAMELPVIATFWSGPEEYMTPENSYPIPIDGLEEILDGPFRGHRWAIPSVPKIREAMRDVWEDYPEAQARGRKARMDMKEKYCSACLAREILTLLDELLSPKDEL